MVFEVVDNPDNALIDRIQALEPFNPFYSPQFSRARQIQGSEVLALLVKSGDQIVSACTAFLQTGRLNKRLEIQSLPILPAETDFWDGLTDYCGQNRIGKLSLNSFGSEAATIPSLGRESWRKSRTEHVLDLNGEQLFRNLKSNHKRNIKKAKKAGLEVQIRHDTEACQVHARLIGQSMMRRKSRGEDVDASVFVGVIQSFAESGAGTFYQAAKGEEVLSSMLVLTGPKGAYYHSAGTTPEGMKMGASHMLIAHIAEALRDADITRFNLGGTDPDQEGLIRFKTGFGARPVTLEAAQFDFANAPVRMMEAIRRFPARLVG